MPNPGQGTPSAAAPTVAETPPLGQRLFDRPFLLLAAGLFVMILFYTGWGLYEILTLPAGSLP